MIPVPDIHQPTRPSPGLVAIMSARAREETLSSMMKHVREQAGIMNRIKWEERTEPGANANASTGAGGHPNKGTQRGGEGVRDSLTEGVEDVSRDFVRCTLSDVVNDIKSEDAEKRQLMDQRREGARARRLQREEQAHAARLEEENERARRRSYSVKSMDGLGGGAHVGGKRAGENEHVGDEDRGPAPEASNAEAFVSQAALLLRATR